MMKVLALLLLLGCGLAILQFDDSPSQEVMSYVNSIEEKRAAESQAFLYLNGIAALENQDVSLEGKKLLNKYNSSSSELYPTREYDSENETSSQLSTPNKNVFFNCKFLENECFIGIMNNSKYWKAEIDQWSTILMRYEKFIAHSEFTTMTKPSVSEPVADYLYLVYGNRLKILSVLSLLNLGRHKEALEGLREDNQYIRQHIEIADNLIHKMIFVSLLENNLNVLAYLSSLKKVDDFKPISLLSSKEIDITLPMSREFVIGFNTLLELDGRPDFFDVDGELPYWFVRTIFKPYMTLNDSVASYSEIIRISQLPAKAFSESVNAVELINKKSWSIRNYAGNTINKIPMPGYSKYIATMHDLNCKIELLNHSFGGQGGLLNNPYGAQYKTNEIKDDLICMEGPLEDNGNSRCIKTGYK